MATLTLETNARIILGAESTRFDIIRAALACTQKVADVVLPIPVAAPGPIITVWQSDKHGNSNGVALAEQFAFGAILIDPDSAGASVLPIDVELASTRTQSVTVTVSNMIRRLDRNRPLLLSSSLTGADFAGIGTVAAPGTFDHITRIRLRNPNAAGSIICRVLLLGT